MSRSALRTLLALVAGLALLAVPGIAATAQDATEPHPSHIHEGTCADLNPNPAYPLNDIAPVAPDATAGSVEAATTTVDVSLDDLTAAPYAINAHASADDLGTYIACGDIAGPIVDGTMLVAMRAQSDSGFSGIAVLATNDAGGTDVTLYLAPPATVASDASPAASEEVAVSIKNLAFAPQVIEVPVGTTVTWTNEDVTQHTVVANDQGFASDILKQGDTFSYTFDTPGTYDYICSLHSSMTGQVIVTG